MHRDPARTTQQGTGALLVCLGTLVMFGWLLRIPILTQVAANFVAMVFNTALCFFALGAALLLDSYRRTRAARILASGVAALAAANLAQYLMGWDLRIDRLFVEPYVTVGTDYPGRMALNTALGFLLVSVALLLPPGRMARRISGGLGVLVAALSFVALGGYAMDLDAVLGIPGLKLMALHTAGGFLVAAVGVVARAFFLRQSVAGPPADHLEAWIGAGFGVALLLLLAASLATVRSVARSREMSELLTRTTLVQAALEKLGSELADVQRGQRGFSATRDEAFLKPFRHGQQSASATLREVQRLVVDDGRRQQVGKLAGPLETFLAQQAATVERVRQGAPREELVALLHDGDHKMTELEQSIVGLRRIQNRLRAERAALAEQANRATLRTTALVSVLAITMVFTAMIWIRRDLRQRRAAERELSAQRQLLASVIENTGDGVCVADRSGHMILMNPAGERILGRGVVEGTSEGWTQAYDVKLPDGSAPYPAEQLPLVRALRGEPVDDIEVLVRRPSGVDIACLVTARPILDPTGLGNGAVATFRDVTERKRHEQLLHEKARELAEANEKLEGAIEELAGVNRELESFSYSVSHDLRAPLRHIAGFAQVLREDFAEALPAEARRYLEKIRNGAVQMGTLIDALLNLAGIGRHGIAREPVQLEKLTREVREMLERDLPERRIEWRIAALPEVHGDRALLKQVFANLVSNAVKYTRSRPLAVIEIGITANGSGEAFFVRDNGVGFDQKFASKLFGVFQRLHRADEFEGTGIGLATVQRIIACHGGRIWADSQPEHGATFYFTLGLPASGGAERKESNVHG